MQNSFTEIMELCLRVRGIYDKEQLLLQTRRWVELPMWEDMKERLLQRIHENLPKVLGKLDDIEKQELNHVFAEILSRGQSNTEWIERRLRTIPSQKASALHSGHAMIAYLKSRRSGRVD